jgi:hypothetical protein
VVGQRLDVNVEPFLDLVEDQGIRLASTTGDSKTLGAKATGTANLKSEMTCEGFSIF